VHPETTHFAASVLRVEQSIDLLLLILALGAGGVLLWRAIASGHVGRRRRVIETTAALALGALCLRLWLFPPAFVHANFRGPRLVDDILAMPRPAMNLGSYGQVTFLVLGALARVFGHRFESVAVTNACFGVATLVVLGALAARWTGRAVCAPFAVAVGVLQPALARTACSEDAHVLGGLLGLIALLAIDVYVDRDDGMALLLAVAAAALMVGSRQTYYPWAPAVVLMGVARGGWGIFRRGEMWVAAVAILLALALRLLSTLVNEPAQLGILPAALANPRLVWTLLLRHPLLDIGRFALGSLPLGVLGIVAMRGAPMLRGYLLLLAATFVVTLPMGFPLPGVECSFRTPVLLLGLVAVASGAERLWRVRPRGLGLAPLGLAIAAPVVLPTWALYREVTPATREYLFVRDVAGAALPASFVLAEIRAVDPMPSYRLAGAALPRAVPLRRADARTLSPEDRASGRVYFLGGLQCRARSLLELAGYTQKVETLPMKDLAAIALMGFQGRVPGGVAPSTTREECARLLRDAEPVGPLLVIDHVPPEDPFVLYGDAPVPIQLWRLGSSGG
jgi:hypothetical protein